MAVEPGGGGKLRNKRNHGNKPYTRHNAENKSLFRRVTDTVASIILPTWMPNFMSWKSEEDVMDLNENHEGNVREDLNFESTSSLHLNENNIIVHATTSRSHPSSKLWPRASSRSDLTAPDGSYDSGAFTSQSVISNEFPQWSENEPVRRSQTSFSLQSECVGVPPSNIHLIAKEPLPDNRSECSDASVSTSGCSSMIPHPDRREYQREILQLNESSLRQLSEKLTRSCLPSSRLSLVAATSDRVVKETTSGPFHSTPDINSDIVEANTSLESRLGNSSRMDESRNCIQHSKPQPSAVGKKPTFNVDAFENPVWNDKSILNESLISSPFYGGPTSFGGASASRRNKYQSYLPYSASSRSSNRTQVRVKNVNSTSDIDNLDGMSSTTRKILVSLEKMSTPLTDAKRIPSKSNFADSLFMMNTTTTRRPNLTAPDPHGSLPLRSGPPLNRLLTPIASTSSKQPRLDVPRAKSASENPKNDAPKFGWTSASNTLYGSGKPTESRKMKTRQAKHYSSKPTADEVVDPPYDLPEISMPILTMPTINFGVATTPVAKPNDYKNLSGVNFRLPSEVGLKSWQKTTGKETEDVEFVFSTPLKVVLSEPTEKSISAVTTSSPTPNGNFAFNSASAVLKRKPKMPESSPSPLPTFGLAKELKTGSVMDLLKSGKLTQADKSTASSGKNNEDKTKEKQPDGTWSCPNCSINNDNSKTNCTMCDTAKPGHVFAVSKGFGDKFKPKEGSWECPICAVRNEGGASKCLACETPKPGAVKKPEAPAIEMKSTSSWGGQFKKASGSWDCDTCMVANNRDDNTCVACNTPRLNSIQTPNTAAPAFKFGFTGKTPSTTSSTEPTGFKFGGGLNPATNVASTFKFGFPTATSTPTTAAKTAPTINTNFVFGAGIPQTDGNKVPSLFGDKPVEKSAAAEAKDEILVFGGATDAKKIGDVADVIEDVKEPAIKPSVFALPASTAAAARPSIFGNVRNEPEKSEKSRLGAQKPNEQFGYFAKPLETPKSAEKHKHESDDLESQPKKKMATLEAPIPSFTSLLPPTFTPLNAPTTTPTNLFKTPELSSTAPTNTTSKTSSFSIKTAATAVSTASSEFLPALPATSAGTASIFRQNVTTADAPPSFFASPATATTAAAASAMKLAQQSTPVFGATTPITMFGTSKTGYNTHLGTSPNSMFGNNSTPSSLTIPSYGYLTTSAGSAGFGTTTTNSIFSPASSASVFQSPPAAVTTTPAMSFFGTATTSATKSSFSFGQTTTAPAAVPQFGTPTPTPAVTGATSFSTPVTTAGFASANMFAFGNPNASIFGRPATTQVATTTTTAAMGFQGFGATTQVATPTTTAAVGFQAFGATPRPAFQAPQLSGTTTQAFAPVAPTNRFAGSGAPPFQFGSNQQQPAGVFMFTGTQENTEPEPATTFQFNQPATTQAGFQFNAGTAPTFNFGAAASPSPLPPAFGTPVPQDQNPFNMPVTTTAPTANPMNRMIRRARRRK